MMLWLAVVAWLTVPSSQHGRMMEPPSRSSMWRVGFPTPKNENDNALYCGGFGVQHQQNGGRCGICGDPWDAWPRQNEAPHGIYATGIIGKTYRQGSIIPVVVEITANHQGHFTFKLCPNDDIWQDPGQDCFDRYQLGTGKAGAAVYPVTDYQTGLRLVYVHLPRDVVCQQCILQWTYTAGNNWGRCSNGTGTLGCGPQETFRSCSDIRIVGRGGVRGAEQRQNTFAPDTAFSLDQFELEYDDLFGGQNNEISVNRIEEEASLQKAAALESVQSKKLRLLRKKLILAKALKTLRNLIRQSKEEKDERRQEKLSQAEAAELYGGPVEQQGEQSQVVTALPWWSRTNSHGRRRRREERRAAGRRRRYNALLLRIINQM